VGFNFSCHFSEGSDRRCTWFLCRHLLVDGSFFYREFQVQRTTVARLNAQKRKSLDLLTLTVYELAYKLQHDCPYNDLTRKLPEITFAHWCNHERDVIEISCEDEDLAAFEGLQKDLRSLERTLSVKITRKSFSARSTQIVTGKCNCNSVRPRSVSPVIEKYNCLKIEPIFYKHGWEWYRILAFRQKDVKELFDELATFTNLQIISRRPLEETAVKESLVLSPRSLLGELTKKQSHALMVAIARGYYEIPKKVSTDEIAKSLDLPRTTYEEHLRKAESKVMKAVAPILELTNFNDPAKRKRERLEQYIPQLSE
jgi:predicted DNA binding protein